MNAILDFYKKEYERSLWYPYAAQILRNRFNDEECIEDFEEFKQKKVLEFETRKANGYYEPVRIKARNKLKDCAEKLQRQKRVKLKVIMSLFG